MARTFAWFENRRRPPSEYEELTVGLHWGGESLIGTELGTWSDDSTKLTNVEWEDFRDPSQLHYRSWVATQERAERELDAMLALAGSPGFVGRLDPAWREALAVLVGANSFAEWGVAMAHQHVHRFCLSSSIAQSAQLQVCDELRHAQRGLEWSDHLFGASDGDPAKAAWMAEPALQPLRRYVEDALTISDWGEGIVAVNLVLEGLVQPFLREFLTSGGEAHNDLATTFLGKQCWTDEERHLGWTEAFVRLVLDSEPANREPVQSWCTTYLPGAREVIAALSTRFSLDGIGTRARAVAEGECRQRLQTLGLDCSGLEESGEATTGHHQASEDR